MSEETGVDLTVQSGFRMCSLPGMAHNHYVKEPYDTCYDETYAKEQAQKNK